LLAIDLIGSARAIHPITPSISGFSPSAAPLAEATRRLAGYATTTLASAGSLLALE
jgi:hypothetical protein